MPDRFGFCTRRHELMAPQSLNLSVIGGGGQSPPPVAPIGPNYRLPSQSVSRGGVRMHAEVVREERADFSALFDTEGSDNSQPVPIPESLRAPFLIFSVSEN